MPNNNDNQHDKMSREEAGQKGGEATLKKHGPEFYSEIGSQQGKDNNPGNFANRDDVEDAARKGGENSHGGGRPSNSDS